MIALHTLRNTNKKSTRRVGRGGKRGKTSGHGMKGQKQHGRHGIRPELRDVIKKLPKRRGYGKNRSRTVNDARIVYTPVNVSQLNGLSTVTPETLVTAGIIRTKAGKPVPVKILGRGTITTKVVVSGCRVSDAAKAAIEKVGGSVT